MMAKTHIVIGIAASLTLLLPTSIETALPIVAGGAIGSLICDVDCKSTSVMKDALYGRIIVAVIVGITALLDLILGAKMLNTILRKDLKVLGICSTVFLVVLILAINSEHRGFSHSLLAMALEGISLGIILPAIIPSFIIAYISHLLLDVLNKKPIRILFPSKREFCLNWFYANKTANIVFMALGCVWLVLAILLCIVT